MSSALALSQAAESRWTVLNGAMKGASRVMNAPQFTMGRSNECEFVIVNDPKCSRKHAMVTVTNQGCEIACLNENNPILINGRETARWLLNDGDIVTLGETEIRFNLAAPPVALEVERPLQAVPGHYAPPVPGAYSAPRARGSGRKKPGGNSKRFIIYGAVALVLYWLLSPSGKKKEELRIRTEQQMQADIEAVNKLKEAQEALSQKRMDGSIPARQAQENYVRGFRDYRDGQYERAQISFQACLALNPEHPLCNRYLRLAHRKLNELVQVHMVQGRKHRDQNRFRSCRASFRNVMVMVKDASSPIYKEAKANYEACNTFVEGRF